MNDNHNLCEFCEIEAHSALVYDTGICGKCGLNAECCDRELIALGISDKFISYKLPRLRFYAPFGNAGPKKVLSIADMGAELSKHIEVTLTSEAGIK